MKRLLIPLLYFVLALCVRADGGFSAKNNFGVSDKRVILDVDGVTPLSKGFGRMEIVAAGKIITSVTDGTGSQMYADGMFALGIVNVPGTTAGSSATIVVRAWDNRFGATYADAVASGGHFGEYQLVVTGLGEGISPPSADAFAAFQSFALNTANGKPLGSVTPSVTGQGQVQISPNKVLYHPSEVVSITAAASPGWAFAGWSGGVVSGNPVLTLSVPAPLSLTANFKPLRQLTLLQEGQGTVSPTPAGPYGDGATVQVTATPAAGWSFAGWQGDATGAANPLSVVLTADATIKAVFQQQFSLQTGISGQGQILLNPAGALFNSGTVVSATPVASLGWRFVGWGGAAIGTGVPTPITMDGNKVLTATFKPEWPVTLSVNGTGTAGAVPAPGPYLDGTAIAITATPAVDAVFTGWSGSITSTDNPLNVVVTSALQLTANFSPTFPVGVSATGSGTVALQPQKARYALNENVTAVATPAAGWAFTGWSGDLTSSSASFAFAVTRPLSLVATFKPARTLTLQQDGQGTLSGVPAGPYVDGATVSVTATAAEGWSFVGWQGGASGSANPLAVTLTADTTIQAVFKPVWPLTARTSGNGSVGVAPQSAKYLDGSQVTLTATPGVNAVFAGWSGSVTSTANPLVVTLNSAVDVTALFLPTYKLTSTITGQGTVAIVPSQDRYVTNDVVTLTATPAEGWDFTGWSGAAAGSSPTVSVRMTNDLTVSALFTVQPPPVDLSGTAVDGYLSGASVFFDANRNGRLDPGEPSTTTDRAGKFTLTVDVKKFDLNRDGKLTPEEGRIVVDGGLDLSTGVTRTGQLTAPIGASVVTPLTTLVDAVSGANPSFGVDESERRVKQALGVPADVSVTNFDPIRAAADGDSRAASVHAANATLSDTVSQLGAVLDRGSSADSRQATDAVGAALAKQAASGEPLNLDQGKGVAGLFDAAAKSLGASFSSSTASVVSEVIAAQNAAKSDAAEGATDPVAAIQQIGKVQAVSQGAATTALGSLAGGDAGADEVRLSFTGVALTAAVEAAPVGDLFATNRVIGTFSLLDVNALATEDGRVVQPLTVVRRDGSAGAVRVEVKVEGGATVRTNRVFLDFADGELFRSVDLRDLILDNATPDPERKIPVTLSLATGAPSSAKVAQPLTGVLTVVDNDAPGTVGFAAGEFSVSEDGTPLQPVVLERQGGSAGTILLEVTPSVPGGGGSTAGADFTTGPIAVSFGPGELRRTIRVPVVDDSIVESAEKLQLSIRLAAGSAPGSAVDSAKSTALVSIIDNDGAAVLQLVRSEAGALKYFARGPVRGRHVLQSSSNLKDWVPFGAEIETQGAETPILFGIPAGASGQFIRAVAAP